MNDSVSEERAIFDAWAKPAPLRQRLREKHRSQYRQAEAEFDSRGDVVKGIDLTPICRNDRQLWPCDVMQYLAATAYFATAPSTPGLDLRTQRLIAALTDDRYIDSLSSAVRRALDAFLPTADDVRGILALSPTEAE